MIKCFEKKCAFSLTEAIITMLILGIVMSLALAGVKLYAPTEEGQTTLSWKMAENIESATLQILLNHSSYDDFLRIKDGNGYFSIEDADITKRMSDLYSKYLSDISYNVDLTNEYFSEEIRDYNKTSTGDENNPDEWELGCTFVPPVNARNFAITVIGSGGGGASGISEIKKVMDSNMGSSYTPTEDGEYFVVVIGGGGGGGGEGLDGAGDLVGVGPDGAHGLGPVDHVVGLDGGEGGALRRAFFFRQKHHRKRRSPRRAYR